MKTRTDYYSHFRQIEVAGDPSDTGNGLQLNPSATTVAPALVAVGDDTNVDVMLTPKGTGRVRLSTTVQVLASHAPVAAGSTLTLTEALHNGKTIRWDTLTGSVVTLPAASGSGFRARLYVSVLATSNSHIVKVANASDVMVGVIQGHRVDSGNAVLGFAAGASDDTITLNRTTTGSVSKGEWVDVEDVATNVWRVTGLLSATGAAFATPFSATV